MLLSIPSVAFWVLLVVGRNELRLRGIAIAIGVWLALQALFAIAGIPSSFFVTAQALLDAVLVLIIFGGDIKVGRY